VSAVLHRAYIGLGSNLENPMKQLECAYRALDNIPQTHLISQSSYYGSSPMGPQDQPDFINSVALVETAQGPQTLLHELQRIEHQQGRVREQRWGPRTLDLDLLLFDQQQIENTELTVPHSGMAERNFVLLPLYEIAPELTIPGLGSLHTLVEQCSAAGLHKLPITTD